MIIGIEAQCLWRIIISKGSNGIVQKADFTATRRYHKYKTLVCTPKCKLRIRIYILFSPQRPPLMTMLVSVAERCSSKVTTALIVV